MTACMAWETEMMLPGVDGRSRVLVCHGCGAILKRRTDGGPAWDIGEHLEGCRVRDVETGQLLLFREGTPA